MNNIYISFSSWEDRFFKSYDNDIKNNQFDEIMLFNYKDGHNNDIKSKKMSKIDVENIVHLSLRDNIENWKIIKSEINDRKITNATINISTMPRNIIFLILHFLKVNNVDIKAIYYNAEEHGKSLTKDPQIPRLVLQHSGIFEPQKKTIVVVLLGYDEKRLYQLYNYFEPEKMIILSEKNHQTQINKELKFDFNTIENKEYKIDSFEEGNVLNLLEREVTPIKNSHNIILCSLGPKLSSIEVFQYNSKHREVALCYISSAEYSEDYSTGVQLIPKYIRSIPSK